MRTRVRTPNRLAWLFAVAATFAIMGGAFRPAKAATPDEAAEIGRFLQAMPWLKGMGQLPSATIPYNTLKVSEVIPQTGDLYSIDSDVTAVAYTYFYHVNTNHGRFLIGSSVNLAKFVHELQVIDQIEKTHKGEEILRGLGAGVKDIGTGIGNAVIHPGISLKNLGQRFRQAGRTIERTVTGEGAVGEDAGGQDRALLGRGPAGGARRQIAYELGVDVYTTNPILKEALNALARARAGGYFTTWAAPYHLSALSSFNPITGDDKAETLIRDLDPSELRRRVGMDLEQVLGMSRSDTGLPLYRLLTNPNYSPRDIAYLAGVFETLSGAGNLTGVLEELADAQSPDEADFLTLDLRIYALLHRNVQPIAEFRSFTESFGAIGQNGVMYIVSIADTLRPWGETAAAFERILGGAVQAGLKGLEVWTIGDVHPAMVENAAKRGVVVRQNILRDQQFMSGTAY